jgi:queuine tRNA-ribosyltransferase
MQFSFEIYSQNQIFHARTGVIHTPHGDIETPAFIPVGTQGTVKTMTPEDLEALGTSMYFVNSYHMYLRPGTEVIKKIGGLHNFMHWNHPIITDSGGFQAFSLAQLRSVDPDRYSDSGNQSIKVNQTGKKPLAKVSNDGVWFRSHWDGAEHTFTPESSMDLQWDLGSDIHIAFDDCTPYPVSREDAEKSMNRTHLWAVRSLDEHRKHEGKRLKIGKKNSKIDTQYQALYGSIQGSVYEDLRKKSAAFISDMDFDGIAIGGVSVGESKSDMNNVLDWVSPLLPSHKPRHLLGVGEIDDIFMLIEHGVDTFDCVQPTRLARMGFLYGKNRGSKVEERSNKEGDGLRWTIDINKSIFSDDSRPIEPSCYCYTCTNFTRAYIHHLFHVRELLAYRLATIHNLHFVHHLVSDIRISIKEGSYTAFKKTFIV